MIVENLEKYHKEAKEGNKVILDYLEEVFGKLLDANIVPEYILCDAQHEELFLSEIKYFSSPIPNKIIAIPETIAMIVFMGYKIKVVVRVENHFREDEALKGIELYGRCK